VGRSVSDRAGPDCEEWCAWDVVRSGGVPMESVGEAARQDRGMSYREVSVLGVLASLMGSLASLMGSLASLMGSLASLMGSLASLTGSVDVMGDESWGLSDGIMLRIHISGLVCIVFAAEVQTYQNLSISSSSGNATSLLSKGVTSSSPMDGGLGLSSAPLMALTSLDE
jgi:hypothetical protein